MAVALDPVITPELKREGLMREFLRVVQDLRKKSGLSIGEIVAIEVNTTASDILSMLDTEEAFLKKGLAAKSITLEPKLTTGSKLSVNGSEVLVNIKKSNGRS
jgi:isoleucyl-tRNA synthetase